jgi:hypothetical protein
MHWIDPGHLPKTEGTVDRFLINPHGEIDGILLADGMEVHVPPHLSGEIRAAVQPGGAIAVYGMRPRHAEMIAAVAIEAGPGHRIVDNGPPQDKHGEHGRKEHGRPKHGAKAQHAPMEAEGTVRRSLHGPKGETRGALLEDGRIIRVLPHEAREYGPLLQPGARLAIRGPGLTADGTTVIDAKEIGASAASLKPVKPKKPEGDEKHPKPHKDDGKQSKHA